MWFFVECATSQYSGNAVRLWLVSVDVAVCTVPSDGLSFHAETGLLHRIRQLEEQNDVLAEQLR